MKKIIPKSIFNKRCTRVTLGKHQTKSLILPLQLFVKHVYDFLHKIFQQLSDSKTFFLWIPAVLKILTIFSNL